MSKLQIEIENNSGFCPGVRKAVEIAENELQKQDKLYCLGDIVHNPAEVQRLEKLGLKVITREEYYQLQNARVMIRSHGEPPATYDHAKKNKITLVDSTCKVVGNLQNKIHKSWQEIKEKQGQIVIYGKENHPETIGLNGRINDEALVITGLDDVEKINFERPVRLFSQTTMSPEIYNEIIEEISRLSLHHQTDFDYQPSVCGWMVRRVDKLRDFAERIQLMIFVSGKKSSNGAYLFSLVKEVNKNARKISGTEEISREWFKDVSGAGIAGATSTPRWQLEQVKNYIESIEGI